MVSISHEDVAATDARLRRVIKESRVRFYDGSWSFEEFPLSDFVERAHCDALALVRDEHVWSQLLPHRGEGEAFALFKQFNPGQFLPARAARIARASSSAPMSLSK